MNFVRGSQALFFLASMTAGAHAQTLAWTPDYSPYPGAFLVSPQKEGYLAPAIYRTLKDSSNLRYPVAIEELCHKDITAMIGRNFARKAQRVAGLDKATSWGISLNGAGDAKAVRVSLGGNMITLSR
jgi:hypothetical protein